MTLPLPRACFNLVLAWIGLRLNPRGAGLEYRGAAYLTATQALYQSLVRVYWVRCKTERS